MSIDAAIIGTCAAVAVGLAVLFGIGWSRGSRISKGNTRCRDCGSQMVERYPDAIGARRHYICKVCGYFDSYIDRDRVKRAQERAG